MLRRLVQDFPDDPVTPFALNDIVSAQAEGGRFDEALQTLGDLRTRFPKYPLNSESADSGSGGQKRSLADRLEAQIKAEKEWASATQYTHPIPSSKVLALVETTVGSLWLGFYEEQAPQHVAKFFELAKSGYFNGTQVYHVRTAGSPDLPTPMLFEAGSAASRFAGPGANPDPGTHDKDEPTDTIEPEDARDAIRQLRGVVSSVSMPSGESARRFMVIGAEGGVARYNGQTTPFAMVLDREGSMSTLEKICRASTYGTDKAFEKDAEKFRMANHPYPPIWIRRVSLWRDEKLEAGHTWDTKLAGQPTPEAWEATLPPPPKPAEFAPKPKDPVTPENPAPEGPK
ncbi:MAG: peptidylprolyl isomerase [Planctomycetes bacterium]|nr:peptidylprolyl isomerase [Planctomycetota bacterium]